MQVKTAVLKLLTGLSRDQSTEVRMILHIERKLLHARMAGLLLVYVRTWLNEMAQP